MRRKLKDSKRKEVMRKGDKDKRGEWGRGLKIAEIKVRRGE